MKQCLWCGKEFTPRYRQQAKKFCSDSCCDRAQWEKRKAGLVSPKEKIKFVNKEFFDWREYNNIVI